MEENGQRENRGGLEDRTWEARRREDPTRFPSVPHARQVVAEHSRRCIVLGFDKGVDRLRSLIGRRDRWIVPEGSRTEAQIRLHLSRLPALPLRCLELRKVRQTGEDCVHTVVFRQMPL